MSKKPWFEVDREGLAEIVKRRGGLAWLIQELISNGWDEPGVMKVDVQIEPVDNSPMVELTVTDDAPNGFQDLSHAWTLFAKSAKRGNAELRGRFNLGEKLVLAFCREASITTTTGTVMFDQRGRTNIRDKRTSGSQFFGIVRMTRAELDQALKDLKRLIPPEHIATTINGEQLENRTPFATWREHLWTELPDEETGALCRRLRYCDVKAYKLKDGETPTLYELGIPVVALDGDPLHVSVGQKTPLNLERDNVTPSYLRELRASVLNNTHELLEAEDLQGTWATDAMAHYSTTKAALDTTLTARFGRDRASADPSDREAENKLKGQGTTIVHGGSLPKEVWDRVRETELIKPAGQLAPTPQPFNDDAPPYKRIEFEALSPVCKEGVLRTRAVCRVLLGREVDLRLADEPQWHVAAVWGRGRNRLTLNVGQLGEAHFSDDAKVYALALHELAHEREANHLCEAYHDEICRLAGLLVSYAQLGAIERQMDKYRAETRKAS
jgi:hypothetical protein